MNEQMFTALASAIAAYYGADRERVLRGESFSLEAPKSAELGTNIQQRSDFLKQINMVQVANLKGKKLWGATEKPITGRQKDGRHLATLDHSQTGFELYETDSGIIVPWAMFDQFASLGLARLSELYAEYTQNQIALDMLQIGFHGTSAAENTTASNLSDVNFGWLALLKRDKPENVYLGNNQNKITLYGKGAEFSNLDELALNLKQGLDLRHQNRTDLVFLVGADLVNAEAKYITKSAKLQPSERAALGSHNLLGSFGGMQAIVPPNFPAKGAVVTSLKNLSIYTQGTSVRRRLENNEDKKGIISGYYRQEGYVVEDNGLMTAVEAANVVIGEPDKAMS